MANARNSILLGLSEFGEVVGAVDTPWGECEEDGIDFGVDLQKHDVRTTASKGKRKSFTVQVDGDLNVKLSMTDLVNVRDAFGLPSSALTGDLHATPATAEVLDVSANLVGTETKHLYAIGMGPAGPRRVDMWACTLKKAPRIKMGSKEHGMLDMSWDILEDAVEGKMITITDNP